ncbi:MAG: hypothetical protein AVDCRST_MAG59-2554, partial [uncultured Thermomicrobiales bacterium]
ERDGSARSGRCPGLDGGAGRDRERDHLAGRAGRTVGAARAERLGEEHTALDGGGGSPPQCGRGYGARRPVRQDGHGGAPGAHWRSRPVAEDPRLVDGRGGRADRVHG